MDLPGTSSDLLHSHTSFYQPPTSPPMIHQVSLIPTLTALYPQLLQLPQNKSDYLMRSDLSAFKDVNELRTTINMMLPMLPVYPSLPNGFTAAGLAAQPTIQHVIQQSLLRKRPAAQTPNVPQPECPAQQLRTVLTSPMQNAFLLNQWMMPNIKPVSPTLPTGSIQAAVGETQAQNSEEQPVKWSSPSSVDSNGQKTDSSAASAGDTQNIDVIGDGSESPASSNHSAQELAMMTANNFAKALKETSFLFPTVPPPEPTTTLRLAPAANGTNGTNGTRTGPERKPRKPVNDDIVKIVRNEDLSDETIAKIIIPVPKALISDPTFRPVPEAQIIQQIIQGKKYEEMEVGECMIQLCKKLAEKRVFGPRLMSQTTVAGLNHSNYSNLPIKGICYIQHVCKKVLYDKFENEEDFWDKFREAMRKLAARCRRVRHAKKTKHNREEAQAELLNKRFGDDMPYSIGTNGLIRPKTEPDVEVPTVNPEFPNMNVQQLSNLLSQFAANQDASRPLENDLLQNFVGFLRSQRDIPLASPQPSQ